jgi:hypothetical protein
MMSIERGADMPKLEVTDKYYELLSMEDNREGRTPTKYLQWILKRHFEGSPNGCQEVSKEVPLASKEDTVDEDNLPISELRRREEAGEWTREQVVAYINRGYKPRPFVEPERIVVGQF